MPGLFVHCAFKAFNGQNALSGLVISCAVLALIEVLTNGKRAEAKKNRIERKKCTKSTLVDNGLNEQMAPFRRKKINEIQLALKSPA